MSKYNFEKLGSTQFEHLVQALLEKPYRTHGHLVQFGNGKDGAREATWTQPSTHEKYVRPKNATSDVDKQWVFQAKFHDTGLRGWDRARADVESDLNKELEKIVNKYAVPCHKYILVTNVPFTGVRNVGTRDKVNAVIETWQSKIPEIEVWDATDLSRMLDADPDTRKTFLGEILPGDILHELLKNMTRSEDALVNSFRTYLKFLLRSERDARAEEAGDEDGIKLEKVFVDLDLSLNHKSANDAAIPLVNQVREQRDRHPENNNDDKKWHLPNSLECVPASFALLRANYKSIFIKGGPGVGKSTLTQFLSLYHAARIVDPPLSRQLAERLKLGGGVTAESLDSHCVVRFPLRIELRHFTKWVSDSQLKNEDVNPHFAAYFVECINKASSSSLVMEDIFTLTSKNPILLLLDGLDEVPQPKMREIIFRELEIFLDRCECEECDVNVILSSRPQGYRGEFDGFEPLEWQVVDLSRDDFDKYAECWLKERIAKTEERADAHQRVADGMESHAVQLMAKTLLQATVMLTIAKRKLAIPHAKHKLYEKFVEVIFEREQNKQPIIGERAEELKRLHEKVGFELISKLEKRNGSQTLQGVEFRNCVERVILDYGCGLGDETNYQTIVDEIVTLAKNRLCLLAGKGNEQEDIDFVIQPFREYFAAAYLALHENADPHRAYESLSARQHVWANVLQFYAAFQSTAQQGNWISEADGTDESHCDLEHLIEMTRRRRVLLKVLPEFGHTRNEYVRRAFKNLMEQSTRWTWRDRDSTAELLDAFSKNQAFKNLSSCFGETSVKDAQSLFVEIDLLVKTDTSPNKDVARKLLSELITEEPTRKTALQIAHLNEMHVDVNSLTLSELKNNLPSLHMGYQRHREFRLGDWKGLSDGKVIDLTVSGAFRGHLLATFKQRWINELFKILSSNRHLFQLQNIGLLFPLCFFERSLPDSVNFIRDKLKSLDDCCSSSYLLALLDSIQNPTQLSLYDAAKKEESELRDTLQLAPEYRIHYQLGPDPLVFESTTKWVDARNAVFPLDSKELVDWVNCLNGHSWMVLLLPEVCWEYLDPLVTRVELSELNSEIFERLKLMGTGSSNIAELMPHMELQLNNAVVLKKMIEIASEIGPDFLEDSKLLTFLYRSECSVTVDFDSDSILEQVENLTCPTNFCSSVVSMLLCARESNLKRIVAYWKSHCRSLCVVVHEDLETRMTDLLALHDPDAIRMAASLRDVQHRRAVPKIATKVAQKYCDLLLKEPTLEQLDIFILLGLPAQINEIELWGRDDAIKALRESGWHLRFFRERLFEIIISTTTEHDRIREVLINILRNRNRYTIEIGLAVVDAIHRLDELTCMPLSEKDWQVLEE